jgi:hypothetical protein
MENLRTYESHSADGFREVLFNEIDLEVRRRIMWLNNTSIQTHNVSTLSKLNIADLPADAAHAIRPALSQIRRPGTVASVAMFVPYQDLIGTKEYPERLPAQEHMTGGQVRSVIDMLESRLGLAAREMVIVATLNGDEPQHVRNNSRTGLRSFYQVFYVLAKIDMENPGAEDLLADLDLGVAAMQLTPQFTAEGPGRGKVPVTVVPQQDDWFMLRYGRRLFFRCDGLRGLGNCMDHLRLIQPNDIY